MRLRRERPKIDSEPLPRKPDAEVLAEFAPEKQEEFFHGDGDFGQGLYKEGLVHFFDDMRGALRGNPDDLATVFTKYGQRDAEGYSHFINVLISQLGDRYFAHQLAMQPLEIRKKVTDCIWEVADRTKKPVFPDAAGEMPAADSGKFYPHTAKILREVQSAGTK